MSIEKLGYGLEKMVSSKSGQDVLKGAAVAAAPVVAAAAPLVAAVAVGGAIGTGIGLGASWIIDKLTDN